MCSVVCPLVASSPFTTLPTFPVTSQLVSRRGRIKLANEFGEAFGHTLPHHVVIHRAELMTDSRLDLGIETTLPAGWGTLAGLRLHIFHDMFHVSPS